MRIRYNVIDSHRTISKKREAALADFFAEVKDLDAEAATEQVFFCDWFEKEYAVKWFEVVATVGGSVVGYLRCLRNPETQAEWFIGDVHVRKAFRHQGIASRAYEKAISVVMEYEAAERIVSSVHEGNKNSIKLHEKAGFQDTGHACGFPNFYFDPKETEYEKWLYHSYPIPNVKGAEERILPLWLNYLKGNDDANQGTEKTEKRKIHAMIGKASEGKSRFEAIWCGNRLVGFRYQEGDKEIFYRE